MSPDVPVNDYLIDHVGFDWPALLTDSPWLLPPEFAVWLSNERGAADSPRPLAGCTDLSGAGISSDREINIRVKSAVISYPSRRPRRHRSHGK